MRRAQVFPIVGVAGLAATWWLMAVIFHEPKFEEYQVPVAVMSAVATLALGAWAGRMQELSSVNALWAGPAAALGVFVAGLAAVLLVNIPHAATDLEAFVVGPLGIGLAFGGPVALTGGFACGVVAFAVGSFVRQPEARPGGATRLT